MASFAAPLETPKVSIGRIFERAIDTVRHKPAVSIALSLVFGAVPVVVFDSLLGQIEPSALVLTVAGKLLPSYVALIFLDLFIGFFVGVVMQGALTTLVLAEDRGQSVTFAGVLGPFARSLLPLIGLGIVTAIGFEIGFTLLVVPGVIVYLLWSVAPAALVVEREGAFMALNRSQELTAGSRWKIFGIMLILEAVNIAIESSTKFIAERFFGVGWELHGNVGYEMLVGLTNIPSCLMWASVLASVYVELAHWKEGHSVETLEQVFVSAPARSSQCRRSLAASARRRPRAREPLRAKSSLSQAQGGTGPR